MAGCSSPLLRRLGAVLPWAPVLLVAGCMKAPEPPATLGGGAGAAAPAPAMPVLVFTPPPEWQVMPQTMAIFLGQWKLPNDGIANVSFMPGNDSTADIAANIDRWLTQFEVAGSTPQQSYQMVEAEGTYPEQRLTLTGTLVSTTQIGGGEPRADWMLVGAVLKTPVGPAYVKILGPRADLEPDLEALWALIGTMRIEG